MKCTHTNVTFVEVIPALHQRIFNDYEYYRNNEYDTGRLKVEVRCEDCGIRRTITKHNTTKQPRWVLRRIVLMIQNGDWSM